MANTYYVNNVTGSNSYPGTSISEPFATIAKATEEVLAGDTVNVMDGGETYYEQISILADGRSGELITFQNYAADSPTIDGRAVNGGTAVADINAGKPASGSGLTNPNTGAVSYNNANLVNIKGNYVVWDGINIKGSLGRGLAVYSLPSGSANNNVVVKNCTIGPNRNSGILLEWTDDVTVDNCVVYESGMYYPQARAALQATDWTAGIAIKGCNTATVKNCTVFHNWGEAIIADANRGQADDVTIEDNVVYDNLIGVIYAHAATNITIQRNFCYRSADELSSREFTSPNQLAINVNSAEGGGYSGKETTDVTIINNIVVNWGRGIQTSGAGNQNPYLRRVLIANNTVVNCDMGYVFKTAVKEDMEFYNNISMGNTIEIMTIEGQTSLARLDTGWTLDYNHWENAVDASATGGNDVIGDPSLVDDTHSPAKHSTDASPYRLAAASDARAAADDLSATFTKDYKGDTRSAWDMGADEYDSGTAPTATTSADVNAGPVPLTVTFTGGPGSMTTYAWDFGDGNTSATQSPVHIYEDVGEYTATLTVTDSDGYSDSASETILAQAGASAGAPVVVEQVIFDAADATYTVTAATAPKAVLYIMGGAIADATSAANAEFGFGIAAGSNLSDQFAWAAHAQDAQTYSNTAQQVTDDYALMDIAASGSKNAYADITGATATTVSLNWTGTPTAKKIISWNFSGNDVTNASAQLVTFGAKDSTDVINGDWNLAIMPFMGRGNLDNPTGIVQMGLGFAKRGGNQVCSSIVNLDYDSGGGSTTQIKSKTTSDRIAENSHFGWSVEVSAWTSSAITFATRGTAASVPSGPVLLMKISTSDFYVGIENTPITAAANDYTANIGFDLQAALGIITHHEATNTQYTDSNAGVFGVWTADGTTDETMALTSKDAVSPTVEKSWRDIQWSMLDHTGTMIGEGPATFITNGFRIHPTTAHGTEYKMPILVIESTSGGSGVAAAFSHDADGNTAYGDTVQFTDLSSPDGVPAAWNWEWGDGTADGATQNPTHVYTDRGEYTVTLEVDGGGTDLLTATADIPIGVPAPTVSFTVTPTTGTAPLSIALDASGSTAGGNEIINETKTEWQVRTTGIRRFGEEILYTATGHTATIIIEEADTWDISCFVVYYNYSRPGFAEKVGGVVTSRVISTSFSGAHGEIATSGPYGAVFTPIVDHPLAAASVFDWDYGDTNTDQLLYVAATNTYATVVSLTAYDVELVVTFPDGTDATVTKTGYITLVPVPTAPRTLAAMTTRLATLEAIATSVAEHMGIISGTWTVNGAYSNVYQITLSRIWVTGLTVTVYEDGAALTSKASVELVDGSAASYYTSFSSPNITIYVHTTGTDNPTTNGSNYLFKAVT